jgi:hypothetical protein
MSILGKTADPRYIIKFNAGLTQESVRVTFRCCVWRPPTEKGGKKPCYYLLVTGWGNTRSEAMATARKLRGAAEDCRLEWGLINLPSHLQTEGHITIVRVLSS